MATAVVLLALAAYIAGLMTSREHLSQLWGKLYDDFSVIVDMLVDLTIDTFRSVQNFVILAYAVVMIALFAFLKFLTKLWNEKIYPILLAILRFIRKWWWVPVVGTLVYLFIWVVTTTMQGVTVTPDFFAFFAFLAAMVLLFFLVRMIMTRMSILVLPLVAIIATLAVLTTLGIIGATLYGLFMILGALIGLLIAMLASIGSLVVKWVVAALMLLALLLPSLIPSCGQGDGNPPALMPKAEAKVENKEETPAPPYTVVAQVTAKAGDGCISLVDRLGVTESRSKELFGTDRLSWCVANSHSESRLVYWHSDPKRWEAPRVCLNEVPGKVTEPERWMLVIWPDGTYGVVMPGDSSLCTPRP